MPRIGLDLALNAGLDKFQWYGKGPGESYSDKGASQLQGIHEAASLASLQGPYDVPQENGNRSGTGWVVLRKDAAGAACAGLRASLSPLLTADGQEKVLDLSGGFNWAASPYSTEAVEKAKHPCDLKASSETTLRLDAVVAGVGSAACGPGVRTDLLAKVEEMRFAFCLEPVEGA